MIDKMDYNPSRPVILVDFDRVIHSYTSGWRGEAVIPDKPVHGALDWLREMLDSNFDVRIFSARCNTNSGILAMKLWLIAHGLSYFHLSKLTFEPGKPKMHIIIDDRAIQFTGQFPSVKELKEFTPWQQK